MTPEQEDVVVNILSKMKGLGVLSKPLGVVDGPVVTGYRFSLPDHLPVAKLLSKTEDIALAVGTESVDIRRVGGEVVVFIPNKARKVIAFTEALTWFLKSPEVKEMQLPIMLGTNFKGDFEAIDLATLPHLLIAGSTGSGKSIFETAIIAAMSTALSPEELQIYLVDTKQVDLTLFRDLAHVKEIAYNADKWYKMYNYIFGLVQVRLHELSAGRARNIKEYNAMMIPSKKMPYILLVIDELADLIEHDKAIRQEREDHDEPKVIDAIKRLIGICRATGVHIIACTQRTSVDIVSGTVKANFPARISLRLPTGTDSRTILGTTGAENLLGKGDMLVQRPDCDGVERFHGPFVRLDDIVQVIMHQDMIKKMLGVGEENG